jgi:hypothetical protein
MEFGSLPLASVASEGLLKFSTTRPVRPGVEVTISVSIRIPSVEAGLLWNSKHTIIGWQPDMVGVAQAADAIPATAEFRRHRPDVKPSLYPKRASLQFRRASQRSDQFADAVRDLE